MGQGACAEEKLNTSHDGSTVHKFNTEDIRCQRRICIRRSYDIQDGAIAEKVDTLAANTERGCVHIRAMHSCVWS